MKKKMKKVIFASLAVMVGLMFVGGFAYAEDPTYPELAGTAIEGVLDDIAEVLWDNLPLLLTLVASLIGLFFIVRLIRKYIGRNK